MCLFTLVSRFLFLVISGSQSGCLGLEKQAFGKGSIEKINFRMILHDFAFIFMTFVGQETGLKFETFQSVLGVIQDHGTFLVEVKLAHPRARVTLFQDC